MKVHVWRDAGQHWRFLATLASQNGGAGVRTVLEIPFACVRELAEEIAASETEAIREGSCSTHPWVVATPPREAPQEKPKPFGEWVYASQYLLTKAGEDWKPITPPEGGPWELVSQAVFYVPGATKEYAQYLTWRKPKEQPKPPDVPKGVRQSL